MYFLIDWLTGVCVVCRQEMIEALRDHLVHMLHTHDGARVTMMCLWHGTAKVSCTPGLVTCSALTTSCLLVLPDMLVSYLV